MRVYFDDGTDTVILVLEDDDIRDVIVDLCEREGWDMLTVVDYTIE